VATNAVARPPAGPPPDRGEKFKGHPIVLYVGRLQARKRLDLLLTACANIPEGLQPILWIVGEGPEFSNLVDLSSKIYQNTEFKGRKTGTELEEIFRAADIFVLPGTGGLAVQEAMSYALPVIVAEGDGTQGNLVKPENGWLIPTDDEEALTDTLKFALSDPINLRKLGQNSFKLVQEQVNIDQMVHTFVTALNKTSYSGNN
jgi:glycosyltransferase involved in cell wall biosynthesis